MEHAPGVEPRRGIGLGHDREAEMPVHVDIPRLFGRQRDAGTVGHVAALRRTSVSPFPEHGMRTFEELCHLIGAVKPSAGFIRVPDCRISELRAKLGRGAAPARLPASPGLPPAP